MAWHRNIAKQSTVTLPISHLRLRHVERPARGRVQQPPAHMRARWVHGRNAHPAEYCCSANYHKLARLGSSILWCCVSTIRTRCQFGTYFLIFSFLLSR